MRIKTYSKPRYTGTKVLEGETFTFSFRWNTFNSKWYVDIKGSSSGIELRRLALLCGKDLLRSFGYGNYLGELWVVDNSGKWEDPTFDGMGTRWTLEYFPRAA